MLHPVHHLSGHLSSLTNFAEFLAFRALSSPVLCRVPLLRVMLVQARTAWGQSLALQFKGGSKQDAWIGIWIVIRAECGHILVPPVWSDAVLLITPYCPRSVLRTAWPVVTVFRVELCRFHVVRFT